VDSEDESCEENEGIVENKGGGWGLGEGAV
jgi:hypothetical protein